jgi:hypothetical protein
MTAKIPRNRPGLEWGDAASPGAARIPRSGLRLIAVEVEAERVPGGVE